MRPFDYGESFMRNKMLSNRASERRPPSWFPSVATPKAAMDGHLKSGHMRNDVRDKISTPSVFMKATTVLILD